MKWKYSIIISFFVLNIFSKIYYRFEWTFALINVIFLLLSIVIYWSEISMTFKDENLRFNNITIFKTLMLVCSNFIFITLLQIINHHNINIFTYIFNTNNFWVNLFNDWLIKPTIVYLFTLNLGNYDKWQYRLVYAVLGTLIINIHIVNDFNLHRFAICINWFASLYYLQTINIFFYNKIYVWIIWLISIFTTTIL